MKKQYFFAALGMSSLMITFQNCSGAKFSTANSDISNLNLDSAVKRAPANVAQNSSEQPVSTPAVAPVQQPVQQPVQPPTQPQVQAACECEFSLKSYYDQGYTTTFFTGADGKSFYPNQQTSLMRLPGNMGAYHFSMNRQNKMITFTCNKGLLSTRFYDFDSGQSSGGAAVLAIAPDCPNIECRFKLAAGYTTTFVTSKSGKNYSPDAQGNMSLPGDFNPYQLNTWNTAGSMMYYRCEKGILTTMDNNLAILSVEPAY